MYSVTTALALLLMILTVVGTVFGQITTCKDILTTDDQMCFHDEYNQDSIDPMPLFIQEKIKVFEITEFNQNDKTITLYISLISYWNDTRIMLKSSHGE